MPGQKKGNPHPNVENIRKFQFKPGQSGNPNGRPKSRVPDGLARVMPRSKAKKFSALTAAEVDEWERVLLNLNMKQLQELAKWEDAPAYPRGLAVAMLFDLKNGNTKTAEKLRERQYGTPVQRMELTGAEGTELIKTPVTPTEAKSILEELEKIC